MGIVDFHSASRKGNDVVDLGLVHSPTRFGRYGTISCGDGTHHGKVSKGFVKGEDHNSRYFYLPTMAFPPKEAT